MKNNFENLHYQEIAFIFLCKFSSQPTAICLIMKGYYRHYIKNENNSVG